MNGSTNKPTTELAVQKSAALEIGNRGIRVGNIDELWRFCSMVVKSGMAPRGMDTPEKVAVAVGTGMEAGLTPMRALQSVVVINGLPSWKGDSALGLVRSSGLLMEVKSGWSGDGDKRQAWVMVHRKGSAEKTHTFSVADAKKAGLWGKQGPWSQYPDRMMYYRALGYAMRGEFSDVLMGMHLSEELDEQPRRAESTVIAASPPPPPDPLIDDLVAEPETQLAVGEVPIDADGNIVEPDIEAQNEQADAEFSAIGEESREPSPQEKLVIMLSEACECTPTKARERLERACAVFGMALHQCKAKQLKQLDAKIKDGSITVEAAE